MAGSPKFSERTGMAPRPSITPTIGLRLRVIRAGHRNNPTSFGPPSIRSSTSSRNFTVCSTRQNIVAFEPTPRVIYVPVFLWRRVILQLRARGAGERECGAFLLGPIGAQARISTFVCYDDLDPDAYQGGGIAFHAVGNGRLWQHCREHQLQVLADVHSHPGAWVGQSDIDQRNPMIPIVGHTAIIVPHFAHTSWWSLKAVGIYEYLGNFNWRNHSTLTKTGRVRLSLR
jgi:proteasome lid subunit RPN8/RPN11